MPTDSNQTNREGERAGRPRDAERGGDVAEPDAPTAAEENEGLSTILDTAPMTGVQDEADEE
ncbi:MAG: hypothetical protein LC746_03170 [Acidobacteria bacterium]|nr:hypothetical protein [Acidobacteriota bacterium]